MPVSRMILYGISIGGMMLGPFLVARYLAYRWQMRMTRFYWGLFVPLVAYVITVAGMAAVSVMMPSFLPPTALREGNLLEVVSITASSFIWSLSYTGAMWLLLRMASREGLTPRETALFGMGGVALAAFFSGLLLATSIISLAVADTKDQAGATLPSQEARRAQFEGLQEQRQYLFEGPVYVPLLPLLKVVAYTPWLIFFSLLVFWGISRAKITYIAIAFILQFGLGFGTGSVTETGPPHSPRALLFEVVTLALSVLPLIAIRAIFRSAEENRERLSETVNRAA